MEYWQVLTVDFQFGAWQISGQGVSKQADPSDMAEYKCVADDTSGAFALAERALVVLVPPSIPVIAEPSGNYSFTSQFKST